MLKYFVNLFQFNEKFVHDLFYLAATLFCLSLVFILFRCASSQPPSASLSKSNKHNNNIDIVGDFSGTHPVSSTYADELNSNDNDDEDRAYLLSKLIAEFNEQEQNNRPYTTSVPFRRANFWKRANFWRKRANFW